MIIAAKRLKKYLFNLAQIDMYLDYLWNRNRCYKVVFILLLGCSNNYSQSKSKSKLLQNPHPENFGRLSG